MIWFAYLNIYIMSIKNITLHSAQTEGAPVICRDLLNYEWKTLHTTN